MTPKPHILVIADGFGAPSYNPRLRSLCDGLHAQGYALTVVVEHIADLPFEHDYPIHELRLYTGSKIDWAAKNIWGLLTDWKNRRFSTLVEQQFGAETFDIVLCSTFHTCPLRAAIDFGKRHHIPVITDIRDIAEQAPGNQVNYLAHQSRWLRMFVAPYQRINIRRRNEQLRQASHVTTVSPWHVEFIRHINPHTHLIYNGYDANTYTPEDVRSEEFIISYCGKFFGEPIQDATLLFEALAGLKELPYKLLIHTNPEGQQLLRELANRYGVNAEIEGYIPQSEVIRLYRRSSILLVLTNQASAQNVHGMMTTKFYEALGVEKPVLCVRSDEECLAQVIHETNAGIAATTAEQARAFILDKYREWHKNGFTRQPVNSEQKQRFTRQYQVTQFMQLISETIAPQVSVIVPVYNAANYLTECVNSLINQDTQSPLQIILVDDGSTDGSQAIIRLFAGNYSANAHRQVLTLTQPHAGQSVARNIGLQHATGRFICFVDADDWLDTDFVSTLLANATGNDVVQCGYKRVKSGGAVIHAKHPRHFYQFVSPCMRLYKSEVLNDVRFPEGMIYEDVVFSLTLWAKRPAHTILPYTGYNYRLSETSTTARIDKPAQRKLYTAIRATRAPWWLKRYTFIRLKIHFRQ